MSILTNLFEQRGGSLSLTDAQAWIDAGLLNKSASGVTVTTMGALKYSAVMACVRVLSESVAGLPLMIYERREGEAGKDRAEDFYLYPILHLQPNPIMTSFQLRETLQSHLALWGNAYCEIEYRGSGQIAALWPLRPDQMERIEVRGDSLLYHYRLPNGEPVELPGWRVWHLRGLANDGILGYSPIALAKQSIGLALAAEEFGSRFFGNGATLGGVLEHPGTLGEEAHKQLKASWKASHGGLSNAHRTAILEEGMSYREIGIPPEDAQFLETRKFQVADIARIYRVPPHMIGDLDRATFSNIEHQSIEFVVHSLRPWLVRWEQSINTTLLTESQRQSYFAEFLVDGLLRGDIQSRYQAYAVARQNGWMSANDVRRLENQNPIEDGDVYLVPLNMVPASAVSNLAAPVINENAERQALPYSEKRATNAAVARQRLQRAQMSVYADVAGRLLRRQANDIGNAAKKMLGQRDMNEFDLWLRDYFRDLRGVASDSFAPIADAYSSMVVAQALDEIGGEEIDEVRLQGFVAAYLSTFAVRHTARNEEKVRRLLSNEDALDDILVELENWREDWAADSVAAKTQQQQIGINA